MARAGAARGGVGVEGIRSDARCSAWRVRLCALFVCVRVCARVCACVRMCMAVCRINRPAPLLPQPMALHVRCMRAVKEKLPMGRYVIVCTLYDSLGGAGLRWSNLDLREGWNDVTSPFQHGGRFDEIELTIDQTIRVVVPCAAELVPSMALMFELVKLDDSGGGEVVGWGVSPACNAANDHISGKLKVPLLAGPIDHTLDKYSKIESCMSADLNRWLCNMYFEVEILQKMSEETRQQQYELQVRPQGKPGFLTAKQCLSSLKQCLKR